MATPSPPLKITFFEFSTHIHTTSHWNTIVALALGKKNDKKTITYMYNNNCLLGRWYVITYSSVDVLDGKCN